MVATDSYRLSVKETTLETALSSGFEVNVPARALQELARLVGADQEQPLSVSVRQNQVLFTLGRVVLSSRLIDGQFPNYRQLLPVTFEHELRIAGAELTEVVRRISLLAQKNAPLRLAFAQGELTVSARPRMSARPASRCRWRSPARTWRSASTRSSCVPGWRRSTRATCC